MYRWFTLLLLLLVACGAPAQLTPGPGPDISAPIITLDRIDSWLGARYAIAIWADGTMQVTEYGAKDPVISTSTLPIEQLQVLLEAFDAADFMDLADIYATGDILDHNTYTIALTNDGHTNTIRDYHGNDEVPQSLRSLEALVITTANIDDLTAQRQ